MKITAVRVYAYRLPLVRPLLLKTEILKERHGFLFKLSSDTGQTAWGEAAPLPGFTRESLADTGTALCALRNKLTGASIPEGVEQLDGQFNNWLSGFALCPSTHFAVETAALGLLAHSRGIPLAGLLSHDPLDTVLVNGLVLDDSPIIETARRFSREGYRAVKIKVGRRPLDEDVARVRDVRRELGHSVRLRLDANRAWSFDDAARFAEAMPNCDLEYVEEPLSDPSRLAELAERTGMRLALDESLVGMTPKELPSHTHISAIILKPTLLGGLERAAMFARQAREMKVKAVVSSCFESSVGIAALAQFAAVYNTIDTPAGLDTLFWFKQDLLTEPIDHSGGCIRVAQSARAAEGVNEIMMTEVSGG
ncbi:MAG: o-succinylbenzoate synthase [candidate division Zixibacteria bacterium]|nr:o-succinylbenzoate synthase [candidate division Zixibacteria bacterium]